MVASDLEIDSREIYVGNISPKTQRKALMKHFAQYGEIEEIKYDKRTHQHKRLDNTFANIIYKDVKNAKSALQSNGKLLNDFHIIVKMNDFTSEDNLKNLTNCAFIHNIPANYIEEDVFRLFAESSINLDYVKILRSKYSDHASKRCGYICFKNKSDFRSGMRMNNLKIDSENNASRLKIVKYLRDKIEISNQKKAKPKASKASKAKNGRFMKQRLKSEKKDKTKAIAKTSQQKSSIIF
ncbi:MAG: hypothetical protein MHMPM18_000836 [Marteilia pararefringens]